MEHIDYDLLFRWFVGLGIGDSVWNHCKRFAGYCLAEIRRLARIFAGTRTPVLLYFPLDVRSLGVAQFKPNHADSLTTSALVRVRYCAHSAMPSRRSVSLSDWS